ncbi:hypothetical protein [Cupriavidus taiwanensis]|uniref:hypothetical protein n=1 Tax=Cupriavidus taiwanensis TaxID=164546 RepID=UPI000E1B2B2C|nr:hypothetical protein [Cupriavidus taiwanensis]SPA44639.1 hypothetical protein CBM2629_A150441 [Cupriavidus taiwanensis]
MKLTIEYDDLSLVVTGEYHRGYSATWIDPGCDEQFEVYRVMDRDVDVTHLYDDAQMQEIEALALEAYGAEDEFARDYAAECKREDARLGAM